jgi:hypothetical protein
MTSKNIYHIEPSETIMGINKGEWSIDLFEQRAPAAYIIYVGESA